MGQLKVVVGGQAGSEAKGACAAFLSRQAVAEGRNSMVVRVAGPNAGHTAYDADGRSWAFRQIPVGVVVDDRAQAVIAAGSEIDVDVLRDEVERLEAGGIQIRHRLFIDEQATILTEDHRIREGADGLVGKLGSTGKGVGAARADRIMRSAQLAKDHEFLALLGTVLDTRRMLYSAVTDSDTVVILEGTQGYVLGLHAGYYPQCTSSDCRAIDFLSMAGIDPHWVSRDDYEVWVVMRTYPIRVAGNSGPLEGETSWEELELDVERTTVTQKIRRVGAWNAAWASDAVIANGGPNVVHVALSMVDYVVPAAANADSLEDLDEDTVAQLQAAVLRVEGDAGATVDLIGTGPNSYIDLRVVRESELARA